MYSSWEPQLSALALLDAHRAGAYDAVNAVLVHTPPMELHVGLVQLASGLLHSLAATNGLTVDEMTDTFREGLLAASVTE